MTAAIAEVPKAKPPAAPMRADTPALKPTQYPTQDVPVHLIVRSGTNRVPDVDDDFIESIRGGVRSAILVRPMKATQEHAALWHAISETAIAVGQTVYKLVYGERRWIAAKKCGHAHIPAVIRELTDTQALEIQIEENEQRKDYNILDRSSAYAHLRAQYMLDHKGEKGFTEEKCCELISQACKNDKIAGRTVQQIIALQKLSRECQEALRKGEIDPSHGYELCRRSAEDQAELLLWLRQQTHHSQGDIPSVRRLKLEIHKMDELREAEKRRQPLFTPPQPGTSSTPVPTWQQAYDQLYPQALKIVHEVGKKQGEVSAPLLQRKMNIGHAPATALLSRMEKEGIVETEVDGIRCYIYPKAAPAQTSAPDKTAAAIATYKPPTEAQLKREEKKREEEQERYRKQEAKNRREERIEEQYRAAFFVALAAKAHICSRLLTHIVPDLLHDLWIQDHAAVEKLAPALGWPAPKGGGYSQPEIEAHTKKHTRKFSGNLLAALLIRNEMLEPEAERMAKYFGVDPKKLRQKAVAAVKEEEAKAKLPKEPATNQDKQLLYALGASPNGSYRSMWAKLRSKGASNAGLRKSLSDMWDIGGGVTSNEIGHVDWIGGSNPRVWFNGRKDKALRGIALLAAVRDLLKIPEKGDVDA